MSKWYESNTSGIVVSTRIRLARNLAGVPFPGRMNDSQRTEVNKKIIDSIMNGSSALSKDLKVVDMDSISDAEALAMVERHIISPAFARNRKNRRLILSLDESISIMLGEEDHIRIQVLKGGLQLFETYEIANNIDTLLSESLTIAFDEQLGYLTECPTNLGTGLRASVMLHLPALESTGEISQLADAVSKIGLTIRGMYGEGSGSKASLYQLSNQVTLGISEKSALDNLKSITMQMIEREQVTCKNFDKISLEDSVFRSFGILKNARLLSSDEMMQYVSQIKIGVSLGIIKLKDENIPIKLMIETQPAMMALKLNSQDASERDIERAKIFREQMS
ncbi:MAG: protein arginine kinase [Oscillospiraceae bacterium]|nr:protein arginine kinase [Oscillospiraceae bacterium]